MQQGGADEGARALSDDLDIGQTALPAAQGFRWGESAQSSRASRRIISE